ncbi:MAG: Mg2+ transporter MgtE [Chlorobi bacterium]|nr:Mg2+ transporter MgtE [Chlorobiota bacterium]
MIEKLLQPEIRDLIAADDLETLSEVFSDWLPADIAGLLTSLPEDERPQAFSAIQGDLAAETFEYLDPSDQAWLLEGMTREKASALLNVMSPDDRTALLEEVSEETAGEMMNLLSTEEREVARTLLDFPENSVGRLMTPDYIAVLEDWTVRRVLDHIRTHGRNSETLDVIYVVDANNRLVDDVHIRKFLLAEFHTGVADLMDNQFLALRATEDQESAIDVFRKYDRTVLPVIDARGRLLGIVTVDDMLDVAEEEATEDIQKFGGLEALDEPYVSTPLLRMVRKRASWLVILFLGEMLTATAMGFFEGQIARAVVLALFVPLIISSGGNSGSQAATLIIRALALGEVKLRDWWLVMRRELFSGLILGLILGTIGFLRIAVWSMFSQIYGPHWALVGLTVGLSLIGIVLWGTLAGSMLPFILKRFGADPATSSAPFVATLVDVTGLIIYFTVAVLVLRGTLL